jgi:hypothetical protein
MLFAPPPGYNTPATNRQNVQAYNLPGQQGLVPQGYNASAQPPAVPGTAPGGMPQLPMQPQGFNPNQMQMANALAGTAPRAAA